MLTQQEEWIAQCAVSHLRGDDANPDVGMGMSYGEAIDLAKAEAVAAASVFKGTLDPIREKKVETRVHNVYSRKY